MQVEAIYNSGKLEFVQPLQLRHQRFRVVVTVPDHEIELAEPQDASPSSLSAELVERAQAKLARLEAIKNAPMTAARSPVLARIDAILGPYKAQLSPTRVDTKALWHEHLEEKYLGRR